MKNLLVFGMLTLLLPQLALAAKPPKVPVDGRPLVFADEPWRTEQPKAGAPHAMQTPKPQLFSLSNGIEVLLIEHHQLPTVTMELTLQGGTIDDPADKVGLASACMGLLTDGTQKLGQIEFNEAMADIGSSIGSYASTDQRGISLATLKQHLDATLDLWADSILQPGMRASEFDRNQQRRLTALHAQKGNPSSVSSRLLGSVIYGPAHAYGRFATEKTIAAYTLADCQAYVATSIKPQGGRLFVVGDITKAEIEAKVGGRLASWKGAAPASAVATAPTPRTGKIFMVDIPGAQQTVVTLAYPGPKRTAADFHATAIMQAILGSGFSSRINMNIREKHGYAYGAGGGFSYNRTGSTYYAQGAVRSDVTGPSIKEILFEMTEIHKGVTPEELAREKDGAILALPARWSTGKSTLATFQNLLYFGLPLDDYDTYVQRVQAVDADTVLAAATAHVTPAAVQLLVVGDAKTVLPQIEELRKAGTLIGELVTLDVDGVVKAASQPANRPAK